MIGNHLWNCPNANKFTQKVAKVWYAIMIAGALLAIGGSMVLSFMPESIMTSGDVVALSASTMSIGTIVTTLGYIAVKNCGNVVKHTSKEYKHSSIYRRNYDWSTPGGVWVLILTICCCIFAIIAFTQTSTAKTVFQVIAATSGFSSICFWFHYARTYSKSEIPDEYVTGNLEYWSSRFRNGKEEIKKEMQALHRDGKLTPKRRKDLESRFRGLHHKYKEAYMDYSTHAHDANSFDYDECIAKDWKGHPLSGYQRRMADKAQERVNKTENRAGERSKRTRDCTEEHGSILKSEDELWNEFESGISFMRYINKDVSAEPNRPMYRGEMQRLHKGKQVTYLESAPPTKQEPVSKPVSDTTWLLLNKLGKHNGIISK